MENIPQTRAEFLQDFLEYFGQHPERRALSDVPDGPDFKCMYRLPDGRKCAIGRWIPDEKYSSVIEGESVYTVQHLLPEEIIDMGGGFLARVQQLHDKEKYWDEDRLSEEGEVELKHIKQLYDIS